jgi:hypothetical protein
MQNLGISTRFWVVPFDRAAKRASQLLATFEQSDEQNRHLVLVGNRANSNPEIQPESLYRIAVPQVAGRELVRYLDNIKPFSGRQ